jgi:hypothetical protein
MVLMMEMLTEYEMESTMVAMKEDMLGMHLACLMALQMGTLMGER